MIVTTAERPTEDLLKQAALLADELQVACVPRQRHTLKKLQQAYGADGVLVVARDGIRFVSGSRPPLFFHPSMGMIRIKRLLAGGSDTLIDVSGASPGDTVIDCTAGLASDAMVFSFAVGSAGSVTAVEASLLLHVIVREGLRMAHTGLPEADAACRRIRMLHGDHVAVLRTLPDRSADIVYFDPMFDRPVHASSSMLPIRPVAVHEPLSEAAVREAVRIARKSVVMKNAGGSAEFARLGFSPVRQKGSSVAYGVIRIEQAR
jgi:hypothetical protein